MTRHKIYKNHRTFDRAGLAAELRRLADEIDAGLLLSHDDDTDDIVVPDELRGQIDIENRKHGEKIEIDIEIRFDTVESDQLAY